LKNKVLIYITLFFLVSTRPLFSQIEITRNINIDDGLAYSQVTSAYKDSRNIMWFGTSAGLSEWNGVEFINYYNFNGLPSSFITSVSEDKNVTIYVGTKKGLVIKQGNRFVTPPNIPDELNSSISELLLTSKGILLILTEKHGVWKIEENLFKPIQSADGKIIPKSVLERSNGDILIGTEESGIYILKNDLLTQVIYHKMYKKFPVVDLVELNSDSRYIALQGLGILLKSKMDNDRKGSTFIIKRDGLPSKQITDLEITSDKKLYVATTNGIAVLEKNKVVKIISEKNGLQNEFVLKIFKIKKLMMNLLLLEVIHMI